MVDGGRSELVYHVRQRHAVEVLMAERVTFYDVLCTEYKTGFDDHQAEHTIP